MRIISARISTRGRERRTHTQDTYREHMDFCSIVPGSSQPSEGRKGKKEVNKLDIGIKKSTHV